MNVYHFARIEYQSKGSRLCCKTGKYIALPWWKLPANFSSERHQIRGQSTLV